MINATNYYLIEIAGDNVVVLSEHEGFVEALEPRRQAEKARPGSLLAIANNGYMHVTIGNENCIISRLFEGSLLLEAFTEGNAFKRKPVGRFASLAAAVAAAEAYAAPRPLLREVA